MSHSRISTVAFTSSLILHGIPLGWGLLTFSTGFDMPEIELEFTEVEMIDPDLLQGDVEEVPEEAAVVEPPAPQTEAEAQEEEPEGPEEPNPPKEEPKPQPRLGEKTAEVADLAPTTSTIYLMLANERIRDLSFGPQSVEIMAPLPDFQFIIQGSGFDPLRDFDYLVLATPDVRDVTQTFLAVEYNITQAELKEGLERAVAEQGETIQWEQRGPHLMGNPRPTDLTKPDVDPRWLVFLESNLAVYVREEFLNSIIDDTSNRSGKTSGSFVAKLARIRRFAAQDPRAGMQAVLKDLRSALKRARGLPFAVPDDIEITAEAAENPTLVIRHRFLNTQDAKTFAEFWHDKIPAIIQSDWKIKAAVGWLYDLIELEQQDTVVILHGKFSRDQAETILQLLADLSRKMLHKTPEEMERDRIARENAWNERQKRGRPEVTPEITGDGAPSPTPDGTQPPADPLPPPPSPDPAPSPELPSPDTAPLTPDSFPSDPSAPTPSPNPESSLP